MSGPFAAFEPSASPLYTALDAPPPELSTMITAGLGMLAMFHASIVPFSVSKMKSDGPVAPIGNARVGGPAKKLATIPLGAPGGIITLGSPGNGTPSPKERCEAP